MENKDITEKICDQILKMWEKNDLSDYFPHVLYVLYGYHKQYPAHETGDEIIFDQDKDNILSSLYNWKLTAKCDSDISYSLYQILSTIQHHEFETSYKQILYRFVYHCCIYKGERFKDFTLPPEINKLIAYFVNIENCKSVYSPFCGYSTIAIFLNVKSFIGQTTDSNSQIISSLLLDADKEKEYQIIPSDPIECWQETKADAVISCLKSSNLILRKYKEMDDNLIRYGIERLGELTLLKAFTKNEAKITVSIVSPYFCYNYRSKELRKFLIENNYLDTIVFLPNRELFGISLFTVILVCKSERKPNETIKMFNAEKLYKKSTFQNKFDFGSFMERFNAGNSENMVLTNRQEIASCNYNLTWEIYKLSSRNVKKGQIRVTLGDLLTKIPYKKNKGKQSQNAISFELTSSNLINVLLNQNKVTEAKKNIELIEYSSENSLLVVCSLLYGINYALHTDGTPFTCGTSCSAYQINTELVTPEYLVYLLTTDEILKNSTHSILFREIPLIIDNKEKQKVIIEKVLQEYAEKAKAEQEADAMRLGIKQNISDLEHMLGTTQFKINQMIGRLEKMTPSSTNYQSTVKALKDNIGYMSRQIHYTGGKIDKDTFNIREGSLSEFINKYADSWNNYGGKYFKLEIRNQLQGDNHILMDTSMLTVLLDNILSNAVRHSFHKNSNYTENNRVEISLEMGKYNARPYIKMAIANNGDPFNEDFTVEDFISRGRFTSDTGRSGLGGYQIYAIVKGHDGYLNIDSNLDWNVIINILLPIETDKSSKLKEYEEKYI